MEKKKTSLTYKIIKGLVRLFYPKTRIEGAANLPEEPCILVGNHTQMNGPIVSELYMPVERYTWCAGEMMHLREVPAYAYRDFWSGKPKAVRWFYRLLSYLIAPIAVCVFNNASFGCINNLEMGNGIGNLATEFRKRDENGNLLGDLLEVDYAMSAAGYGCKTYRVRTMEQLVAALEDAKKQTVSTLLDIKVLPKSMTDGYGAWWHVGLASTSKKESVQAAYKVKAENLSKARKY